MDAGTAIRIHKDRLKYVPNQTLEITNSIPFDNQKGICIISANNDFNYDYPNDYTSEKIRRYIINHKTYAIFEVDPTLIHSSKNDDRTEIYASNDFPFKESEIVSTKGPMVVKQNQNPDQIRSANQSPNLYRDQPQDDSDMSEESDDE